MKFFMQLSLVFLFSILIQISEHKEGAQHESHKSDKSVASRLKQDLHRKWSSSLRLKHKSSDDATQEHLGLSRLSGKGKGGKLRLKPKAIARVGRQFDLGDDEVSTTTMVPTQNGEVIVQQNIDADDDEDYDNFDQENEDDDHNIEHDDDTDNDEDHHHHDAPPARPTAMVNPPLNNNGGSPSYNTMGPSNQGMQYPVKSPLNYQQQQLGGQQPIYQQGLQQSAGQYQQTQHMIQHAGMQQQQQTYRQPQTITHQHQALSQQFVGGQQQQPQQPFVTQQPVQQPQQQQFMGQQPVQQPQQQQFVGQQPDQQQQFVGQQPVQQPQQQQLMGQQPQQQQFVGQQPVQQPQQQFTGQQAAILPQQLAQPQQFMGQQQPVQQQFMQQPQLAGMMPCGGQIQGMPQMGMQGMLGQLQTMCGGQGMANQSPCSSSGGSSCPDSEPIGIIQNSGDTCASTFSQCRKRCKPECPKKCCRKSSVKKETQKNAKV